MVKVWLAYELKGSFTQLENQVCSSLSAQPSKYEEKLELADSLKLTAMPNQQDLGVKTGVQILE